MSDNVSQLHLYILCWLGFSGDETTGVMTNATRSDAFPLLSRDSSGRHEAGRGPISEYGLCMPRREWTRHSG
jgi:hypothetical protein